MLLVSILLIGVLGSLEGLPLENPTEDYGKYFTPFIVGGVDAPEGFAIYMVALIFGERVHSLWCGASMVSENYVLTAAHCIDTLITNDGSFLPSFHGSVGSNKWNSGGTRVNFVNHHIHPEWNRRTIKNDIAVIGTERIAFNDKVGVIALNFDWVDAGVDTFVTGWGRTGPRFDDNSVTLSPVPDDLQLLHKQTIDANVCRIVMASHVGTSVLVDPRIEICTFHSRGRGMCNGDSGSALVSEKISQLIGIVSWGSPCATGAPDIFTRLSPYYDFLNGILRG